MNNQRAKVGEWVRVTDEDFRFYSVGTICECINYVTEKFKLIQPKSVRDEVYSERYMDTNRYQILTPSERAEIEKELGMKKEPDIVPSMVVISFEDWKEYQMLKAERKG